MLGPLSSFPQGLSSELGAFVAGVMLSATEQQEFTLHQIESIKAFFLSLFICSTGLVMSPVFLMQHLRILAGGVVLTIASKTLVVGSHSALSGAAGCALFHLCCLGVPG